MWTLDQLMDEIHEWCNDLQSAAGVFARGMIGAVMAAALVWLMVAMASAAQYQPPASSTPMAEEPAAGSFADHAGATATMRGA